MLAVAVPTSIPHLRSARAEQRHWTHCPPPGSAGRYWHSCVRYEFGEAAKSQQVPLYLSLSELNRPARCRHRRPTAGASGRASTSMLETTHRVIAAQPSKSRKRNAQLNARSDAQGSTI